MKLLHVLAAGAVVAAIALPAAAEDYRVGDLLLEQPWSRATPAGARVAGGYLVIVNQGSEADRLVGGSAPFAGRVEIHEMAMESGVMRMRPLADGLEIPAGGRVALEPGGYHVMFMQLAEPLVEGTTRPATLEFARSGAVEIELPIAAMGARAPH